jgi:hypothetical protein
MFKSLFVILSVLLYFPLSSGVAIAGEPASGTPSTEPAPTKDATPIQAARTEVPSGAKAAAAVEEKKVTPAPLDEAKIQVKPVEKTADKKTADKPSKKEKWTFKVGGFMRGDLTYNMGHVFHVDSPLFAYSETDNDSQDQSLGYSARLSRVKFQALSPMYGNWRSRAFVEVDFYGNLPNSGTAIRQAMPRMRLAYAELKNGNTTIRFGNDWMVAAPQFASGLEPFNLWGQGNIWMRYPQINVRHMQNFGKKFRINFASSVGQNMANDGKNSDNLDSNRFIITQGGGENTGIPVVQARLGADFKIGDAKWSTIGVSYSWQPLQMSSMANFDSDMQNAFEDSSEDEVISSFFAVDAQFKMKIGKTSVKLTGEFYQGTATATYWGGILNGIGNNGDLLDPKAIVPESRGGFADIKVVLPMKIAIFGGYGMDTIINTEDLGTTARVKNNIIYAGLTYSIGPKKPIAIIGLSFAMLKTEFNNDTEGTANSIHAMLTVPF